MGNECNRFVRRFAGTVVLTGFLLGWFVSEWFFLIHAFAGINMIQSTFTGICPPRTACEMWNASSG